MDTNYLLEISEDWLKHAIQRNLLHQSKDELMELKDRALKDSKVQSCLHSISEFHGTLVTNHKNPELPIHRLMFLLDIGLDTDVPEIKSAIEEILKHKDSNGIYQSLTNVPKHFGGSGEDAFSWCLCDAPLLLLVLLKTGLDYKQHIKQGVDYLVSFEQDNGFPCTVSQELGKFRGPGKKSDCCPYATLLMANLLSHIPEYHGSDIANRTALSLLSLWENSLEKHPYLFYMGTDFRKLKAPSFWYDIISVVDVLSRYETVRKDKRFQEMLSLIDGKQDTNGLFTPEAVYQKLRAWDFGQKNKPSPYLTYLCLKILDRVM